MTAKSNQIVQQLYEKDNDHPTNINRLFFLSTPNKYNPRQNTNDKEPNSDQLTEHNSTFKQV